MTPTGLRCFAPFTKESTSRCRGPLRDRIVRKKAYNLFLAHNTFPPPPPPVLASIPPTRGYFYSDQTMTIPSPSCTPYSLSAPQQVAEDIEGKTDMQCFHRWTKVFNGGTKGPWSAEDDARVAELVGEIGAKKWSCIAAQLPGRTGKQCRERWHNHLNPHINKMPWSEHEV